MIHQESTTLIGSDRPMCSEKKKRKNFRELEVTMDTGL